MIKDKPYITPPIDINACRARTKEKLALYRRKLEVLKEDIEKGDPCVKMYDDMIEYYITHAKVSQNSHDKIVFFNDYPVYPVLEEELMSVLHGKFKELDKLPKTTSVLFDLYETKMRIDQRTLFHEIKQTDEDYAKLLAILIDELNDIITGNPPYSLEHEKAKYLRKIHKFWLADFNDAKNKLAEAAQKDRSVMLGIYAKKINDYQELTVLTENYLKALVEANTKIEKNLIAHSENVIKILELKFEIRYNKEKVRVYKIMELGKEYERQPTIKIDMKESIKYFDDLVKEFNYVIQAKEKIILALASGMDFLSKREAIENQIKAFELRDEIEAHKEYAKHFDQRKTLITK